MVDKTQDFLTFVNMAIKDRFIHGQLRRAEQAPEDFSGAFSGELFKTKLKFACTREGCAPKGKGKSRGRQWTSAKGTAEFLYSFDVTPGVVSLRVLHYNQKCHSCNNYA